MRIKWSGGSVREDRVGDDRVEPDRRVEQGPVTTPVVVDPAVEHGEEPVEDVATAYGLAQVLAAAVVQAGVIDDELINDAIHTLEITTVFGNYQVDPETGMQTGKEIYAIQIQDGKREIVWPAEAATAELIFPAPAWNER